METPSKKYSRLTQERYAELLDLVRSNKELWEQKAMISGFGFIRGTAEELGITNERAACIMTQAGVAFTRRKVKPKPAPGPPVQLEFAGDKELRQRLDDLEKKLIELIRLHIEQGVYVARLRNHHPELEY